MLSVHHPHVGNKNECVQKWREITAWAFTPPRGPLRSFKQWTGPEERKYIKFRKSVMHAVSVITQQYDDIQENQFGLEGDLARPTALQYLARRIRMRLMRIPQR